MTPKFAEPGQIWLTEQACSAFGIDVEAISRRDRAKSLRQLTVGIDFVTLAVHHRLSLGGAGEDPNAHRLGTWTRVYREDKRDVMIALIPGMGAGADDMPILAEEPTPARVARRLQLLADALRFPWKINAGVSRPLRASGAVYAVGNGPYGLTLSDSLPSSSDRAHHGEVLRVS